MWRLLSLLQRALTLSWRKSLSNRNQPIDLPYKSVDWFLHDRDFRHEIVKNQLSLTIKLKIKYNYAKHICRVGFVSCSLVIASYILAAIHLFKINNGNTRTMCEICSKLIIKTLQWTTSMRSILYRKSRL